MKYVLLIASLLLSYSVGAEDKQTRIYDGVYHIGKSSSTTFKVNFETSKIAWEQMCKQGMIDKFNFSKHYADLFSTVYLNKNVDLIKEMSKQIDKKLKADCKDKGYLDFHVQSCYEDCYKNYPSKKSLLSFGKDKFDPTMNTLCTATCSYLHQDIMEKHNQMAELLDVPEIRSYVCPQMGVNVDRSSRGSFKEVDAIGTKTQKVLEKSFQH